MKKALFFLLLPCLSNAGTLTITNGGLGKLTIANGTGSNLGQIFVSTGIAGSTGTVTNSIAIDTTSIWTNTQTSTPKHPTWNITIGNGNAGSNNAVFVMCAYTYPTGGTVISSVTIGGSANAFTLVNRSVDSGNQINAELWYYLSPPTGSQSVQVNPSVNLNDTRQACAAIDFVGVSQTTPVESSNTVVNSGSPASASFTASTANDWLIDSWSKSVGNTLTPTNGQTFTTTGNVNGGSYDTGFSTKGPLSTGSFADSYTFASGGMNIVAAAVKPAP